MRHILHTLRFAKDRLIAQARAGSWGAPGRTKIRYTATAIDQDGVLLLMPRDPSLAFYYVPLAIVSAVTGALLGVLS